MTWKKQLNNTRNTCMQGMYELVSSFVLFTTHISYSLVLNYSCEAIKSIYVYAFFFPFSHTYQKETLFFPPNVFKIDTDIVFLSSVKLSTRHLQA